MDGFLAWTNQNWLNLLQSVGIIGGLALTSASIRRESAARKVAALLSLTANHRELWTDAHRRPELGRIFKDEIDLVSNPISTAEEEFLNVVIVHFHTGWLLAKEGELVSLDEMESDVASFFKLPIPRTVWERTKNARNLAFVGFVESCLKPSRTSL